FLAGEKIAKSVLAIVEGLDVVGVAEEQLQSARVEATNVASSQLVGAERDGHASEIGGERLREFLVFQILDGGPDLVGELLDLGLRLVDVAHQLLRALKSDVVTLAVGVALATGGTDHQTDDQRDGAQDAGALTAFARSPHRFFVQLDL